MYVELADDEHIGEPEPVKEKKSVPSMNIDYEVDGARPLERPRRDVRAPKYLDEYLRLVYANEQ